MLNSPTLNFSNENFTLYSLIKVERFYQGLCHGNYIISRDEDFTAGAFELGYSDAIYTNNQHCNIVIPDSLHQNYFCGTANATSFNGSLVNANYVEANKWNCVIGIGTSDSIKLYVDGSLVYQAYRTGNGATTKVVYKKVCNRFD